MVIDGHSHACGKFLTIDGIIKALDDNGIDKVVLVPGELNSKSEYSLPNIAAIFPKYNVVKVNNYLTKFIMNLTGKVKDISAGHEYVRDLKLKLSGRIIQFIWITTGINNVSEYLESTFAVWNINSIK